MSLEPAGFIELPGGQRTGFDHTATNAIDVIDCPSNTYLRSLPDLSGVAGVLIDSESDLLFSSDRAAARVSIFRCSDEEPLAQVAVGPRPNALAFDTRRRHLYSFNLGDPPGTDCTASVVSLDERRVVRTIALSGRPRWAVFDPSSDSVYVNIQSPAVISVIDAAVLMESGRIEVGAEGPHGLALAGSRLFCAADGGDLVVVEWFLGVPRVVKRMPLRGAPDVVMHDERRKLLFVAIGSPGVVMTFDTDRLEEVATVETEEGAHTIGWDQTSGHLYAFAPKRGGALVFRET